MVDMIKAFSSSPVITAGIFGFLFLSIFTQLLLGFLYQKMIKEADNMATTDNKLLKQCKLKFANCYQLNNGVANIPVFVDKFLNRLALGPFSFETLHHLSGQSMLISVIFAGAGICKAIADGWTLGAILPFYIISFMGLYLYFSVSSVVDVKGRRRVLKVNLVDYLENHLSARMEVTEGDMEMLYGENASSRARHLRLAALEKDSRRSRRTVELMPFGNRTVSGTERDTSVSEAEASREAADASPKSMPSGAQASGSLDNFRITDEELEALIKEFC